MDGERPGEGEFPVDPAQLVAWLADEVDPSITSVRVSRLGGGHSSGAWRMEAATPRGAIPMVLKAPGEPSVVYQRSAVREAHIMRDAQRLGAPLPEVLAVDDGTGTAGRPCFVMAHVDGRAVADAGALGYHADDELRAGGAAVQRAVWESFHDALAALHSVDASKVPAARIGAGGVRDVIEYWRASLLDTVPAPEAAPRQVSALDWLAAPRAAGCRRCTRGLPR